MDRPITKYKSRLRWSPQEESLIQALYESQGKNWKQISDLINQKFPDKKRNPKQCRQRYSNFIKYDKNPRSQEYWSPQEEEKLHLRYNQIGSRWVQIAKQFQGRSPNEIKNKFYGSIRRFLRKLNTAIKKHWKIGKRQISYCSIYRLLETENTRKSKEINEKEGLEKERFIKDLKDEIIKQMSEASKEICMMEAIELANKINKFNILSRPQRIKKAKNAAYGKKNKKKSEEDEIYTQTKDQTKIKMGEQDQESKNFSKQRFLNEQNGKLHECFLQEQNSFMVNLNNMKMKEELDLLSEGFSENVEQKIRLKDVQALDRYRFDYDVILGNIHD